MIVFVTRLVLIDFCVPVAPIISSLSPVLLTARILPEEVCVEGLGMASAAIGPGQILLTGGSSRGGRGAAPRVLLRGQAGWRSACVESSTDWGTFVLVISRIYCMAVKAFIRHYVD